MDKLVEANQRALDLQYMLDSAQQEVERLRSDWRQEHATAETWKEDFKKMQKRLTDSELLRQAQYNQIAAKDARIDLLDSDQKRYHAAWMAAEEDKEEQAARIKELEAEVEAKNKQIKELQDIIDKPPEDADWVADYHLLQSALDGPIIDAARKWHAAYRKAQNSNLMRAKEVERLQSAPKSGLYGKYIIQKADGSPVDPEADYFILRLDADPVARIAALEYAIQTDDQKLGEMLEKRVMDHVFSKDDQCRKRVEGWPIGQIKQLRKQIAAKDARIKELEEANRNIDKRRDEMAAFIERLEAAFLEAKRCPTCNGAGKLIDVVISRNLGRVESERVCPLCEGKWEEKAREALEEIKTGGAMSNSVDICPFDDDLTCPLDYHTCEIYRERMEEEQ